MTQIERIEAGLEKMPMGLKIVDGEFCELTLDDKYEMGIIGKDEYNTEIDKMRESEYQKYTDKIGLMVIRGEATKEEWLQAMDEIRAKYPHKE